MDQRSTRRSNTLVASLRRRPTVMADITICSYCDEVHARPPLTRGTSARCTVCHSSLYHAESDLGAMLAITITAALAFVIANAFPLVTLTTSGRQTGATLWSAIAASYNRDLPFVAVALTATLIITPLA